MAAGIILTGCSQNEVVNSDNEFENVKTRALPGQILINEIKVSDSGTDTKDWIELYNTTEYDIPLENLRLYDSGGPEKAYIIGDVTIPVKGRVTFTEGEHFSFGLGKSGETVTLADEMGNVLDIAAPTVALNDNINPAWARTEDGGAEWAATSTPTKGTSNIITSVEEPGVSEYAGALVISEVKVSGDGNDNTDWIEILNKGTENIPLYGFRLTDASGGSYTILDQITIGVGQRLSFEEETHFTFGLGKTGEIVTLLDNGGDLIDRIELDGTFEDNTYPAYARVENTQNDWAQTSTPTRNQPNVITPYENPNPTTDFDHLHINEVKASKSGTDDDDFIELYNSGTSPIDISGLKIYDGGGIGKAWTIPAGTIIGYKGFVTFTEDTHFSFGLSAKGDETVTLAKADGSLIDTVALPALTDDVFPAYARIPDGTGNFTKVSTPTKDASNSVAM